MIGSRIKRIREEKGYSITELARLAEVSKSYLSQIEKGNQSNPSLEFLHKISEPLETKITYFLEEVKAPLDSANIGLDQEWIDIIKQAGGDGLKKEEFKKIYNFLKYQAVLNEKKKLNH